MLQGDIVASCDSYGIVKMWDVRTIQPLVNIDCGPHPANKVVFDSTGKDFFKFVGNTISVCKVATVSMTYFSYVAQEAMTSRLRFCFSWFDHSSPAMKLRLLYDRTIDNKDD